MATHRPLGLSVLSFAFLGLTIAAFDYAERVVSVPSEFVPLGLSAHRVTALVVLCGITGASVAIGAWISGRWVPWAIACWGLSVGALMFEFQRKLGGRAEPLWLVLFPFVMLLILTWMLAAYAARRV